MSDFKIVQLLNPIQINVPINPTGVYNAATTYGVADAVSYGNSSYICILASTGNIPTNTTYWQLLASSATNKLSTTARNQTGFTIPSETVVYFSGVSGNVPTLALAQANNDSNSARTIGITATSIANNANGEVVIFGLADNLNTSAFTAGSSLWLSPSVPGGLTMTKPSAPDHMVFIGFCTRSHPTDGTIEVKVQNGFELEELHNVAIASVANGQTLQYESATSLWKNHTLTKSDVGLSNVDNTSDINKPISTATQDALNLITNVNWTGDYNNGVTYTVGQGVMYNGASFRMIAAIGAAGYPPVAYPANWLQVTDYVSPNDIGLGNVPNVDATDPANIIQTSSYRFVTDTEKSSWNGKQDALGFTPEDAANKATDLILPDNTKYPTTQAVANESALKIGNTFESVSKNLRQYDYALNYSSGVLTTIVYTVPSVGTITKTLNYSSGVLTSVVLSGSTPSSISLTKTLTYSSGVLTSIAYT